MVNTGRELNVYINAPEDDYHHTQGLCGTFDGRRDNDQTGKDGHVHHWSRRPDSFVESWRYCSVFILMYLLTSLGEATQPFQCSSPLPMVVSC